MRIVVTGATGNVGTSVVQALAQDPDVTEIVGVARQVKERPDETEDLIQIYVPNQQVPHTEAYLLVRTGGEAEAQTPDIRRAIARVAFASVTPCSWLGSQRGSVLLRDEAIAHGLSTASSTRRF